MDASICFTDIRAHHNVRDNSSAISRHPGFDFSSSSAFATSQEPSMQRHFVRNLIWKGTPVCISSLWLKNLVSPKKESFQETQKTHYTSFKNSPVKTVDAFFDLWSCFNDFFSLQKPCKSHFGLKVCITVYYGRQLTSFKNLPVEAVDVFFDLWGSFHSI